MGLFDHATHSQSSSGSFPYAAGSSTYINNPPSVQPHPLTFLLIELLLDQLLHDLDEHSRKCPVPSSADLHTPRTQRVNVNVNVPLTQTLLKERDRKGKSNPVAYLTEDDIEMREWAFQRYFYVWSINSLLKVPNRLIRILC